MNMQDMMKTELGRLCDMEEQLAQGLQFLSTKASDEDLREALEDHRETTLEQVRRIRQISDHMGWPPPQEQCQITRALVKEARETFQNAQPSPVCDAFIIAAAQKAEHLEIASYGTAATFADLMDDDFAKDLLGQNLDEEKDANKKLTKLAEGGINEKAVESSPANRASVR